MVTEKTPKRAYKRRIKGVFLQFVTGDGRSGGGIGKAGFSDFGFGILDCGLRPIGAIEAYAPEGRGKKG